MALRKWLVASCLLNGVLITFLIMSMRKEPTTANNPSHSSKADGLTLEHDAPKPARVREELPSTDQKTAAESDGASQSSMSVGQRPPRLDPAKIDSLAANLALGQSAAELPDDEIRGLVADALQPTDVELADAQGACKRAKDEVIAKKVANGDFQKGGGSLNGEGELCGRMGPDGKPIAVVVRRGDSTRYDDALARLNAIVDNRKAAVGAVLKAWNSVSR